MGTVSKGLTEQFSQAGAGTYEAQQQADAALQGLNAQARTLAFIDSCSLLAVGAVVMLGLTVLLKHNNPHGAAQAQAH